MSHTPKSGFEPVHGLPSVETQRRPAFRWASAKAAALPVIGALLAGVLVGRATNSLVSTPLRWLSSDLKAQPSSSPGLWKDIKPSRQLEWHPCYDGEYECARLDVPMDWLDPSDSSRVQLAVIRLEATDKADYKGPVFFNPGGPGGSGVYAMTNRGKLLQTIVGKNHDIITWDPRGIGASVPRLDCWASPEQSRLWKLQDVGVYGAHPGVLSDIYTRAQAFSENCERNEGNDSLLAYSSTASHARDLLEILHQTGTEKLRYWGFSYGTILGGVFAALYPDKVERLVSDGNVDYNEWFRQTHINYLRDTDKVMEAFYYFCHEAGPELCAFYADSPAAVEARLQRLFEALKAKPVVISATENGPDMPQLVTWSHLKRLTSTVLYQPNRMFKKYSKVLLALEQRNGRPFYELGSVYGKEPPICPIYDGSPAVPEDEEDTADAFPAIMCSDLPLVTDTLEEFSELAEKLVNISSAGGAVNTLFRLACVGRTIRPKWRFDGPFEGNTSHPILYIGNIADNVTPLVSARNNSAGFPGSVILVQNSYGHTTLSAASTCTANYIRGYFQNGTMPAEGTTCEPDSKPFGEPSVESTDEISAATRELSRSNWESAAHFMKV